MSTLSLFVLLGIVATASSGSKLPIASHLVDAIAGQRPNENLVFSPACIQHTLAFLYLGAEGKTAAQLRSSIGLSQSKEEVVKSLVSIFENVTTNSATLKIGTRLYVDKKFEIIDNFKQNTEKFHAQLFSTDFEVNANRKEINEWVEQQTLQKVQDLMTDRTEALLVNNIYFQAEWEVPFSKSQTHEVATSGEHPHTVHMMVAETTMLFKESDELKANVVQLRLKDTDIRMLILQPLPDTGGLAALEAKLKGLDLTNLQKDLVEMTVTLMAPKFRIEFDMSLKPILKNIGVKSLFKSGNFSSMFTNNQSLSFFDIRHKTYMEIDEKGVVVASVTGANAYSPEVHIETIANHSFFFALVNKHSVYFTGHWSHF